MTVGMIVRNLEEDDMAIAAISYGSEEQIESSLDGPGVLMFTSSFQLCYKNLRATELCEQLTQYESTKIANGILPLAVTNLADEIHRLIRIRTESKDWQQFQIRRVSGSPNHPVVLCGFGVVEAEMAQSRIVIVMQVAGSAFWHKRVLGRSKEKFQLTWRQTNILHHLLKGWTNKEIANTLSISEQTVKEHIKLLLAKMCVTTRTGIVMKAVLSGVEYETQPIPSNSTDGCLPYVSRYSLFANASQNSKSHREPESEKSSSE